MKSATLKCTFLTPTAIKFHIYKHHIVQIEKEIANIWEYKVGNNANIVNFVRL